MIDLSMVFTYVSPIIVIACLTLGYVIKHAFENKRLNAFIPLILALVGISANVWYLGTFTLEVVVAGAVSGLAATGLYEGFSNILNLPNLFQEENEVKNDDEKEINEYKGKHFQNNLESDK